MIRFVMFVFAALLVLTDLSVTFAEGPTHVHDVVYGRKFGMALTMDILKPSKPNGQAIIFVVSGGFNSDMNMINSGIAGPILNPFTERGMTIFLVAHGSQPKYSVSEIVTDLHRAVRFIRSNAKEYKIDPNRIGITGISSGGYLALMMGTQGKPGSKRAPDPIDQESSRVQAVACFCPPSDLVNYGKADRSIVEFESVRFVWHAFDVSGKPRDEQTKILKGLSPFISISKDTPPTLIYHGDADPLVPIEQSERFIAKLSEEKIPAKLEVRKGEGHTWTSMSKDAQGIADWFDKYLPAK
jgi:acetyl esterase/lipase